MKTIRNSVAYKDLAAKFPVSFTVIENKKTKIRMPTGWQTIKEDRTLGNENNFAIITRKVNDIVVVDLDKPKEGEIDGIKYFEEKVCKINDLQTLVSKTVNGGYHIYYKYTNKLKPSVRLKNINDIVSIDIKTDGGCVFEGTNYSLVNDYEIDNVPEQVINLYHKDKEREKIEESLGDSKLNKEGIGTLLDNLSGKYYENYQEWVNVLCCLKNINCDKQIAEEFSSKSDKFNKEDFNKKWNSFDIR